MRKILTLIALLGLAGLLQAQVMKQMPAARNEKVRTISSLSWVNNSSQEAASAQASLLWQQYKQQAEALSIKKVLDTMMNQVWLGAAWMNSEMTVNVYDATWNNLSTTTYETSGSGWDPYEKTEFLFNTGGQITHEYSFEWNGSSWDTMYAAVKTYDGSGKLLTLTNYSSNGGVMEPGDRTTYTYSVSGRLDSESHQYWDGSVWTDSYRVDFVYNTGGQKTADMYYLNMSGIWTLMSKSEYTYNANGHLTLQYDTYWDGTQWVDDHKIEYTVKANGDPLTEIEYYTGMSGWDPAYKTEYSYDAQDNVSTFIYSDWGGSAWEPSEKYDLQYNNTYTINDLVLPYMVQEDLLMFRHMLTTVVGSSYNGSSWDQEYRVSMIYSTHGSGIGFPENPGLKVRVYPNPVSESFNVVLDGRNSAALLQVYDLQGKLMKEVQFEASVRVNCSEWADGLYYYKVSKGQEILFSGKLVVRH